MQWIELIRDVTALAQGTDSNIEIAGVEYDSRRVQPGSVFIAMRGGTTDGNRYIDAAIRQGAAGIVTDSPEAFAQLASSHPEIPRLLVAHGRTALAQASAAYFGHPERKLHSTGVTGTNGKTTTAFLIEALLNGASRSSILVGTIEYHVAGDVRPSAHTTPESRDLFELMAEGLERDATELVMEVSSHALDQGRVAGVSFDVAVFTNLTRDHLDYHRDMARYRAAKERLFTELLGSGQPAILNCDSSEFPRLAALCRDCGHPVIGYGADPAADLRIVASRPSDRGQRLVLEIFGRRHELLLPLFGEFQAMNALCALGLAIATGIPAAAATAALAKLSGVPGRLEFVAEAGGGAPIVVDYAHTPDALATVLAALRPHAPGRLVAVFGCGGDRDPGKRALMGRVAADAADQVYVTDDNPRSEDPAAIRHAILSAAPGAIEIDDRRRAIATAIADLAPGDLLVIAGKGHETGQIIGGQTFPFDDAEIARDIAGRRSMLRTSG